MSKNLEKQAFTLLERIANASGRTIDTAYASLVHKLGLTQPFFKVFSGFSLVSLAFRAYANATDYAFLALRVQFTSYFRRCRV